MTKERCRSPEEALQERKKDLDWIEENRDVFWLTATVAFEEIGRGAIVMDLAVESTGQGDTFSYLAEGELKVTDERLRELLDTYDPDLGDGCPGFQVAVSPFSL